MPDRSSDVERLTAQIAAMPGVRAVNKDFADSFAQGRVYFRVYVDLSDDVTAAELATITSRFLDDLGTGKYAGYRAGLVTHQGWSVFAIDIADRPIANTDQVEQQARDWVALRHEFPTATVALRATVVHPSGPLAIQELGHSNTAHVDLPDAADYTAVVAAVNVLSAKFADLSGMDWRIDAGKLHPAEVTASRRFPNAAELQVFEKLNADQSVPHIDAMRINAPATPPVWVSEKTTNSHDVAVALELATLHLPIVAVLPPPVLYSASDQLSGNIGDRGLARGPVSVTIGGCTPRDPRVYVPSGAELALIKKYSKCRP